jgi:hypothetical protein
VRFFGSFIVLLQSNFVINALLTIQHFLHYTVAKSMMGLFCWRNKCVIAFKLNHYRNQFLRFWMHTLMREVFCVLSLTQNVALALSKKKEYTYAQQNKNY